MNMLTMVTVDFLFFHILKQSLKCRTFKICSTVTIVKDLSRLGRNYIETGRYLEKIFPFLGVRFIAVTDHYDSAAESDDADQIIVPFKNLINDAYCRDISIKIRSQLDVKRKRTGTVLKGLLRS